jgi:hypothetical protein
MSATSVHKRGRTRRGRLALLDAALLHLERDLIVRSDGAFERAVCVDLGLGDQPWTTLDTARCLNALHPGLPLIGVDIDPLRLRRARRLAPSGVQFRQGGFALPLERDEPARLVRAMNVLREYDAREVPAAHRALGAALVTGGLLIEGTSTREGGVLCAHWLRKRETGLFREGLLFCTDFSQGFAPCLFRDVLPRDLRRHTRPHEPMYEFLRAWCATFEAARSTGVCEASALFAYSGALLSRKLTGITLDACMIERGCMLWKPRSGVPHA